MVAKDPPRRQGRTAGELGKALHGARHGARDDVVAEGAAVEAGVEVALEREVGAVGVLVEDQVAALVVDADVDGDAEVKRVCAREVVAARALLPHLAGVTAQVERQGPLPQAVHLLVGVEHGAVTPAVAMADGRRVATQQRSVVRAEGERPVVVHVDGNFGIDGGRWPLVLLDAVGHRIGAGVPGHAYEVGSEEANLEVGAREAGREAAAGFLFVEEAAGRHARAVPVRRRRRVAPVQEGARHRRARHLPRLAPPEKANAVPGLSQLAGLLVALHAPKGVGRLPFRHRVRAEVRR